MRLANVTYVVCDYDEALKWFVDILGFELREDTRLSESKRWVRVAAPESETCLLLAKADGQNQHNAIRNAAGGRVAFFLHTDDFDYEYRRLLAKGVKFREVPRHETYGTVAVFEDLYENAWDLIGLSAPTDKKLSP
jgi:catechol 2,3-dioxygenase-like lactoylglutathione lyase family enzyme